RQLRRASILQSIEVGSAARLYGNDFSVKDDLAVQQLRKSIINFRKFSVVDLRVHRIEIRISAGFDGNHPISVELWFEPPLGTVLRQAGNHHWLHRGDKARHVLERPRRKYLLHISRMPFEPPAMIRLVESLHRVALNPNRG